MAVKAMKAPDAKSQDVKSCDVDAAWAAKTILPIALNGGVCELEARAYQGEQPEQQALVLLNRAEGAVEAAVPLVRVHSGCVTGDVFHSLRCDCYPQLQAALDRIAASPGAVLIYLPYQEGRGIGLVDKIRAYALQDQGADTVDANLHVGAPIDGRDYDLAACILRDLGLTRINLLTNNPAKISALEALGIQVAERTELITPVNKFNRSYIETKRLRMFHQL